MIRAAVLTGAGISRQSGIPTFVEMGNIREKLSRTYYERHAKEFFEVIARMKKTCDAALPNQAHVAIARYGLPVITMNIDSLHIRAGSQRVCEIHGNLRDLYCSRCAAKYGYDVLDQGIFCPSCGGKLNPDIVLYGDMIPRLEEALGMVRGIDRLLVVGTSFYTSTASYITEAARAAGARIDIINEDAKNEVPRALKKLLKDDTGGGFHA